MDNGWTVYVRYHSILVYFNNLSATDCKQLQYERMNDYRGLWQPLNVFKVEINDSILNIPIIFKTLL